MPSDTVDVERVDSCKLSCNAKGKYSFEVKVYAEHLEDAIDTSKRLANDLRKYILDVNKD